MCVAENTLREVENGEAPPVAESANRFQGSGTISASKGALIVMPQRCFVELSAFKRTTEAQNAAKHSQKSGFATFLNT